MQGSDSARSEYLQIRTMTSEDEMTGRLQEHQPGNTSDSEV